MQNVFTEGYDPTADPTISANVASAILQAVRQATGVGITPSTPTGTALVLFGATSPDVVTNPFFATCLWMDQTDPLKPVVRWYNAATPAWETFKAQSSSITADSIADGLLSIAKLASTGGAAHNVIRLKSPLPVIPPYYEFVDPSVLFPNNTVDPNVLQIGGDGTYLTSDGVSATWKVLDSATIIGLLANHSIDTTKLVGTNIPLPGTFLFSWGGNVGWATSTQLSNVLASMVLDNSQNPNILISGNGGQVLTTLPSGAVGWTTPATPPAPYVRTKSISTHLTDYIKPSVSVYTVAHGLGAVPADIEVRLVCLTDDSAATGYIVGDEIDIAQVYAGVSSNDKPIFGYYANATTVGVVPKYYSTPVCLHKTTGVDATLTLANWAIKVYVGNVI